MRAQEAVEAWTSLGLLVRVGVLEGPDRTIHFVLGRLVHVVVRLGTLGALRHREILRDGGVVGEMHANDGRSRIQRGFRYGLARRSCSSVLGLGASRESWQVLLLAVRSPVVGLGARRGSWRLSVSRGPPIGAGPFASRRGAQPGDVDLPGRVRRALRLAGARSDSGLFARVLRAIVRPPWGPSWLGTGGGIYLRSATPRA